MGPLRQDASILFLSLGSVSAHIHRFHIQLEEAFCKDALVHSVAFRGIVQDLFPEEAHHLLYTVRPQLLIVAFPEDWSCQDAASVLSSIRRNAWKGTLIAVLSGVVSVHSRQLLTSGAEDVVTLPDEFSTGLFARIARLFRTASECALPRRPQALPFAELVGNSAPFRAILEKIPAVAASDSTVLISGETGTGKGMVARAIHDLSGRSQRPFVKVQCSTIPDTLVENELFGHAAGAYTNGSSTQAGMVEGAEGGTLFLDDIDALSLITQAKLLQLVEDKLYRSLGMNKFTKANIRLIVASNIDLEALVRERRFRSDLYYRLRVIHLQLPPLSERREDIPLLAEHFLRKHTHLKGEGYSLTQSAVEALAKRDWPGNVRELENLIEGAIPFVRSCQLDETDLGLAKQAAKEEPILPFKEAKARASVDFEHKYLLTVLRATGWKVSEAARLARKDLSAFRKLMRKRGISNP
jgi:two-component system, NtrC family, response regulator GlrR